MNYRPKPASLEDLPYGQDCYGMFYFLVTGPESNRKKFAFVAVPIARQTSEKDNTVWYKCDARDEGWVERVVRATDVTLQRITTDEEKRETYTLMHIGKHGMQWEPKP